MGEGYLMFRSQLLDNRGLPADKMFYGFCPYDDFSEFLKWKVGVSSSGRSVSILASESLDHVVTERSGVVTLREGRIVRGCGRPGMAVVPVSTEKMDEFWELYSVRRERIGEGLRVAS